MLKRTSMILATCSLFMSFQAYATLDETLRNIDFDAICNGEGGSSALGGQVAHQLQKIIFSPSPSTKDLIILLEEKGKGSKAAKILIEQFLEERKTLDEINLKMLKNYETHCKFSK
ncbi:MAG: hypothetical protein H0X26_09010 [Alphaproteobacteria bacterium]|nr:hypothetical protein [Alphaproteobacteria bacterium]